LDDILKPFSAKRG